MRLTERGLNRATLARQLLLAREPLDAAEAVRRVVAIQAQEPASPYVALWARVAGFDPADLDVAFAERRVVKATLMRMTLHAVHADDRPAFHAAMHGDLRADRLADPRFTAAGVAPEEVDAMVADLLGFLERPRSNGDIEAWLTGRSDADRAPVWWAARSFAPVIHAPTGPPWSFSRRPAYLAAEPAPTSTDAVDAVPWLVRRYLAGFGPASVPDVAQCTKLGRAAIRDAVTTLGDQLVTLEAPDGVTLLDLPGAPLPDEATPAPPRLLPMWDSVLLAYADRTRIIPSVHRAATIRRNGDALPTLLVDGRVAGVWRAVEGGIEATAFEPLSDDAWEGLAAEAAALVAFLGPREPLVFGRYCGWWRDLPAAEVRVLP